VAERFVAMCLIIPIAETDVTTIVAGDATAVNNDTEEDEAKYGNDFDDTKDEFDFTVTPDAEKLYNDEGRQEDSDPNTNVIMMPIICAASEDGRFTTSTARGSLCLIAAAFVRQR
jgi:hypothetical protein